MERLSPHAAAGATAELRGIGKRFGATVALHDVSLRVAAGSVHALVGENGAGKSTLARILTGSLTPDVGELRIDDQRRSLRSPRQARDYGITLIAQELSLVPDRTVTENIYLGQEPHRGPFVRRRELAARFQALVERTGIEVPGNAIVSDLPVSVAQRVEILRALASDARLIVMDEPTARLTAAESARLRALIGALAAAGTTVILVSHFLDEVLEVSDTVTILRDGHIVRTGDAAAETKQSLVQGMIGRRLDAAFPARPPGRPDAPAVLQVRGLSRAGVFSDVDFDVHAGEIVVMAGLVGAGRSEIARVIYGADRPAGGHIGLNGRQVRPRHPADAIAAGMAMIPEARKRQGLQQVMSITDNVLLPHLRAYTRHGLLRRRQAQQAASAAMADVSVKASSPSAPVQTLSGGNQQKVLFARSFSGQPQLLIADEPTRGVDIGAKRAIYDLIAAHAAQGMAVLVVSSEIEEVIGLADRVLVVARGRIAAELTGSAITEQAITEAAFGLNHPGRSEPAQPPETTGQVNK